MTKIIRTFNVIFLVSLFSAGCLHAQCPITVSAGPDKHVCNAGGTVTLDGSISGSYVGFRWTPSTGLSSTTVLNPTATVNSAVTYTLTGAAEDPSAPNLVNNPGFESGNTGFTSTYTYTPLPITPGTYFITTSPSVVLSTFPPCDDHTYMNGTGNMMLINGNGSSSSSVWCQTIPVMANSFYILSAWATCSPISPPVLQFKVNGTDVGDPYSVATGFCNWQQFSAVWFSGTSTSANMCIFDVSGSGNGLFGDDYALDDISMTKACAVSDMVNVSVITVNAVLPASIVLKCNALPNGITLNGSASSSGPGYTYSWSGPGIVSGGNTPIATVNEPGDYTLTVSYDTGNGVCSKDATIHVLPDPNMVTAIANTDNDLTCIDLTATLNGTGSSTGGTISYQWQPSSGIVSGGTTLTPKVNQPGEYTLLVTNSISGCTATATTIVNQNKTPAVAAGSAPGQLNCTTSSLTLSGNGSSTGPSILYEWSGPGIVSGANTQNNCIVNTAGSYSIKVTNDLSGCTAIAYVNVISNTTHPTVHAAANAPGLLTCKADTLILNSTGSSTGAIFKYLWTTSNGHIKGAANGSTVIVDTTGNYVLKISNTQNGCTSTDTVHLTGNFTKPVIKVAQPAPAFGCTTDSVRINASMSSSGSNFIPVWKTTNGVILSGDSTLTPWVDTTGKYILTIVNTVNGCIRTDTVAVGFDTIAPVVNIAPPALLNCLLNQTILHADSSSGNNLSAHWTFSPAPGSSGPAFLWGQDSIVAGINKPGTYYLTLTSQTNHCIKSDSVVVLQDVAPPIADAGPAPALDCVMQAGTLDGSGSSQGPNYSYLWSNGDTTLQSQISTPGLFVLVVANATNGCTAADSVAVTLQGQLPDVDIATPGALTCLQPSIQLAGTASTGPQYAYSWSYAGTGTGISSGGTTLTPTVVSGGTYTLLVTNMETGCTATSAVTLSQSTTVPAADAGPSKTIFCGTASLILDGSLSGTGPGIMYAWSTANGNILQGENTLAPEINAPGTYTLVVSNTQNGCSSTAQVTVGQDANAPLAVAGPPETITCISPTVTLNGTGSSTGPSIQYLWTTPDGTINSGATTLQPVVSAGGTYFLQVTDTSNHCQTIVSVPVTDFSQPPVAVIAPPPSLSCVAPQAILDGNGSSAGPGFVYFWTGPNIVSGANTLNPVIDGPGVYILLVTGVLNGCTSTASVTVSANTTDLLATLSSSNPSCNGLANGQAAIAPVNGTAPYAYSWSSGGHDQSETGLTTGNYQVTVMDVYGCSFIGSVQLTEPPALTLVPDAIDNTVCVNAPDGSITLTAGGGTGMIQISWSNGQSGPMATGLVAGEYQATATDANGCTATTSATVKAIDTEGPVIQAANTTLALGAAGSITLTLANLGATVTDNCGLTSVTIIPGSFDCNQLGNQMVTISGTDLSGNSASRDILVHVIDNQAPELACPDNVIRCAQEPTVIYAAPVAIDNCLVLGGQFSLVTGLPSGSVFPQGTTTNTYSFADASGNVGTCAFTVTILAPIQVTLDTIFPDIAGQHTGGVQVGVTGSQPGYSFTWKHNGQTVATTEDLSGVGAGMYTLIVTDAAGCTTEAGPYEVTAISATNNAGWVDQIGVFPNPTAGKVFVLLPDQLVNTTVYLSVLDAMGRQVLQQENNGLKQFIFDLTGFAEGLYSVQIRINGRQGVWKVVRTY
jgi:hypothetical protein